MSTVAAAAVEEETHPGLFRDLVQLSKPRITRMVAFTSAAGLWLAPDRPSWLVSILAIAATAMVVSAANMLNQYLERDSDALMFRTRTRPLASGRLSPGLALAVSLGLGALSVAILVFLVNPLAGLLAFIALVSYVWIYTPMKRLSTDALLVGAVPGAMPPLIGWVSATGQLDLQGIVLFSILFVWQLPHFLAIAIMLQDDYARGGLRVHPVVRGERSAKRWAIVWSVAQLLVSLLVLPMGMVSWPYGLVAVVAGLAYLAFAVHGLRVEDTRRWARQLMFASIFWLGFVFTALMVWSK